MSFLVRPYSDHLTRLTKVYQITRLFKKISIKGMDCYFFKYIVQIKKPASLVMWKPSLTLLST